MKSSELVGRARERGGWGPGWNEGGRGGLLSFLDVPFSIIAPLPLPSPTVQEPRQSEHRKTSSRIGNLPFSSGFSCATKNQVFRIFLFKYGVGRGKNINQHKISVKIESSTVSLPLRTAALRWSEVVGACWAQNHVSWRKSNFRIKPSRTGPIALQK